MGQGPIYQQLLGGGGVDTEGEIKPPTYMLSSHQLAMWGFAIADRMPLGESGFGDYFNGRGIYSIISDKLVKGRVGLGEGGPPPQTDPSRSPYHNKAAYDPDTDLAEIAASATQLTNFAANPHSNMLAAFTSSAWEHAVQKGSPETGMNGWKDVLGLAPEESYDTRIANVRTKNDTYTGGDVATAQTLFSQTGQVQAPDPHTVQPIEEPDTPSATAPSISQSVDGAVDAFEKRHRRSVARNMSRVAASLFAMRAVMTSSFDQAMTQAVLAANDDVSVYDQELRTERVRLENQNKVRALELNMQADLTIAQVIADMRTREQATKADVGVSNQEIVSFVRRHNDQMRWGAFMENRELNRDTYQSELSYDERIASLNAQAKNIQVQASTQFMNTLLDNYQRAMQTYTAAAAQAAETKAAQAHNKIVVKNDETQFNMQVGVKDSLWDLDLWRYAKNAIGATSGIPHQDIPSEWERRMIQQQHAASMITGLAGFGLNLATQMGNPFISALRG